MFLNKQPIVSVIMLTYNREMYVERAIRSILNQTFEHFELIVIDNGSTDRSPEIAASLSVGDSRMRVLRIPKSTIGAGRNVGLRNARGAYVAFVDDDDYAEPDFLEFLYGLCTRYQVDIALCGSFKEIDGERFPNYIFDEVLLMDNAMAVEEMLKREKFNVAMPSKMIRKEVFDKVPFFEESKYDDIWTGYRLLAEGNRCVAHGKPKYSFRRHSRNNSVFTTVDSLLTSEQLTDYMKAFRERSVYLEEKIPEIADMALYSEFSWMISMVNKIKVNDLKHCRRELDLMSTILAEHESWFLDSPYLKPFEREFMEKYISVFPAVSLNAV